MKSPRIKSFILVFPGFERLALEEIEELIKRKSGAAGAGVLEAEAEKEDLIKLIGYGQSFRKVLVALDKSSKMEEINLSGFNLKDYFGSLDKEINFKVEVERVKGNENRIEISKKITQKIFSLLKEKKWEFNLKVDYKKPDLIFLVYFDQKKYFLGIDLCGIELNKRYFRVFPHSASFKGDLAYYLIRKANFQKGKKLIVGFVKDGTLAIEAALYNFNKIVNKNTFAFEKFPLFKDFKNKTIKKTKENTKGKIYGFDPSVMNITAARKNIQIAGLKDLIELNKMEADEMDVKFKEGEIDCLVFYITRKDEDKLNEIYYQANYVLKKKGSLLLVGRSNWEISFPEKFKLITQEELKKGESSWRLWLLEKR